MVVHTVAQHVTPSRPEYSQTVPTLSLMRLRAFSVTSTMRWMRVALLMLSTCE